MGSFIEINDTLQLTKEQGFPAELNIETHLKTPFTKETFTGRIFEFKNKKDIRLYKAPPVRNFLVENVNGKWIYWGKCHVIETTHDTVQKTTSGKFVITYINTPEEMRQAFHLCDERPEYDYFENN
jgi:hypothetical protein